MFKVKVIVINVFGSYVNWWVIKVIGDFDLRMFLIWLMFLECDF